MSLNDEIQRQRQEVEHWPDWAQEDWFPKTINKPVEEPSTPAQDPAEAALAYPVLDSVEPFVRPHI